jgi:hypothetical protein
MRAAVDASLDARAIHRLVENLMRRIGNRRTRSSFAVICGSLGVVVIAAIFG